MIWLAWRQHRVAVLVLLGYALLGVTAMVALGLHVEAVFVSEGMQGCLVAPPYTPPCPDSGWDLIKLVWEPGTPLKTLVGPLQLWLAGIVVLAGLLVGAPLFAREYAQGTQRFVLTQSVGRRRWYLTKLAAVAVPAVLAAAALQLAYAWLDATLGPVLRTWSRFEPSEFELRGLLLPVYTLFAVVLGAVAGLLVRRSVAAISVTLVTGGLLAVVVPYVLRRDFYLPPVSHFTNEMVPLDLNKWPLAHGYTDGHRMLSLAESEQIINGCPVGDYRSCLSANGVLGQVSIDHPGDRFWPFQYIEAGLFLLLTTGALALGAWALRRRPG